VQLRAAEARSAFGVDGAGTTVGILSDSFNRASAAATHSAEDVATGDLPGAANTCTGESTPVGVLDDSDASGEDEGRAMSQIVHDLAPGAKLGFATAFTGETAFAENIEELAKPTGEGGAGAKVIADDVTYFAEPFFQESVVGKAASKVVGDGVSYFSSAANNNLIDGSGRNIASWEAPSYRDAGSCPAPLGVIHCMDFNPGAGVDPTFEITVEPSTTLRLDLQWAEPWEGVATDLDAFLISGGSLVASSIEDNINVSGQPFEFIGWSNTSGSPAHVQLAINRFAGVAAPRLKFALVENGSGVSSTEYPESSGGDVVGPTIFGHNGGEDVTSVAAASSPSFPFFSTEGLEDYSSRGPVTHYFAPVTGTSTPAAALGSPEVLAKPDLTATDCGVTTFFALFDGSNWRFCGTSAAAPHAAAVAALMSQRTPGATPEQIRAAMQESARPIGAFGPSAIGAGLVDALLPHTLAVNKTGSGSGIVTVDCNEGGGFAACASPLAELPDGTGVRVTATAASGSTLASLTGTGSAACGLAGLTTGTCEFTIAHNSEVTADFAPEERGDEGEPKPELKPESPIPKRGTAVAASVALVTHGKAFLHFSCRGGGACGGRLYLVVKVPSGKGSKKGVTTHVIGTAGFSIAAGKRATVPVPLSAKGKALVRKAGGHGLAVLLRGGGVRTASLHLRAAGKRKHGGHRA